MKKLNVLYHSVLILLGLSLVLQPACTEGDDDDDDNNITVGPNEFLDSRDNEVYKTVKIGDQVWMAENLRYKTKSGSWYFNNKASDAKTYGMLYNFNAAQNACPEGWHLPTDEEWKQLEEFLGMPEKDLDKEGYQRGADEADKILEDGGNTGFNAQYAGIRSHEGSFLSRGVTGEFWSATIEISGYTAWSREVHKGTHTIGRETSNIGSGFSVRCIKD